MSTLDWIAVVGLVVTIFGAAWALFDASIPILRRYVICTSLGLGAGLVSEAAIVLERGTLNWYKDKIRNDLIEMISETRTLWTFEDFLAEIERRHTGYPIVLRPILSEVLVNLVEEEKLFAKCDNAFFDDGPSPIRHIDYVYKRHC